MEITPDQEAEFRLVFDSYDKDNSGTIERKELREVFAKVNRFPSEMELKNIIDSVDDNKNDRIDFKEFLKVIGILKPQ